MAQNLAVSLVGGAWTTAFVYAVLQRRLPHALQHLADELSSELLRSCPVAYAPAPEKVAAVLQQTTAFTEIHTYCQQAQIWPAPDLASPQMAPIAAFARCDLPSLETTKALAAWLHISTERLAYFADPSGRHENDGGMLINHYNYQQRKKRNGEIRLIEAPKPALKTLQRQILGGILDQVPVHENAYGFVKGRSCIQAAAKHAGEARVISFDLKGFFPRISGGRVYGLFRSLGYPQAVATALTGCCTTATPHWALERLSHADRPIYRQIHLPQGAPTSPALANAVCFTLDTRLAALAQRLGANYSRYADDLTFSGDCKIGPAVLRKVPKIIKDCGFVPNSRKTRLASAQARQTVTGIVVNRHINIARPQYDQLKAVIHACGNRDDERWNDALFRQRLLGQIGWVETVNPNRGVKLRLRLERAIHRRIGGPQT